MPVPIDNLRNWANQNAGFVTLLIFIVTLILGWLSGIFRALRQRPRFNIHILNGPSFCCTFETGEEHQREKVYRTAIALYLKVSNTGSAPSAISNVLVGYHNYDIRYIFRWYWVEQTAAFSNFTQQITGGIRTFPFLLQRAVNVTGEDSQSSPKTYLEIGEVLYGVVYFEQLKAWGGFRPRVKNGQVKVKVRLLDAFGRKHHTVHNIPVVSLEAAREMSPAFGTSIDRMLAPSGLREQPPNNRMAPTS